MFRIKFSEEHWSIWSSYPDTIIIISLLSIVSPVYNFCSSGFFKGNGKYFQVFD